MIPYYQSASKQGPRSTFLKVKVSPGCSYVWRSLVAALPIPKRAIAGGLGMDLQ